MENVYLQMYCMCILYFNCFRDSRIESQQVIMCARARALKVYWKAFTPRTWPYWDLTYTLCFWPSRIEVLSRASWHSSVNWPAEGCTKVCRNGDPGGFMNLIFGNLFLNSAGSLWPSWLGRSFLFSLQKQQGLPFGLWPAPNRFEKHLDIWILNQQPDFNNYIEIKISSLILKTTFRLLIYKGH